MDNEIFRQTYRAINQRFCPYEKTILTHNGGCSRSDRFCIAEREGVQCRSDAAQTQCLRLLQILREQSRFSLKTIDNRGALAHGQAMRVQVGGLRGLRRLVAPDWPIPAPIEDIFEIVEAARERFGDLEDLPFQILIRQIATYQGRKRSRPKR